MKEIFVKEIENKLLKGEKLSIIDVREYEEVENGKIPSSTHIPLSELQNRLDEININKEHYILCHSGGRSARSCEFLTEKGYDVTNIADGIVNYTGELEF